MADLRLDLDLELVAGGAEQSEKFLGEALGQGVVLLLDHIEKGQQQQVEALDRALGRLDGGGEAQDGVLHGVKQLKESAGLLALRLLREAGKHPLLEGSERLGVLLVLEVVSD